MFLMLLGVKYDLDASRDSRFKDFLACLSHFASTEISCEFIFDDEIKPCVFVLHSESLLFSHSLFFIIVPVNSFSRRLCCIYCFVGLNHSGLS